MNLRDYRILFAVCCLGLSFFAVTPALNMFVPFYVEEPFSELSILGSAHMAKDYPFNVEVKSIESLFVTVGNHMGESLYYAVYVKFRNQSQSIPENNEPSSLAPLYELGVFLLDGEKWERMVNFTFLEALRTAGTVRVKKMMINNVVFEVDSISTWDSEYNGFYFQLFFELWLHDMASRSLSYYEQGFVGVWLNMTI